jgi:hypothetical protein
VEDLFTKETFKLSVSGGKGGFTFPLERWDCRAFVSDLPPPAPKPK